MKTYYVVPIIITMHPIYVEEKITLYLPQTGLQEAMKKELNSFCCPRVLSSKTYSTLSMFYNGRH